MSEDLTIITVCYNDPNCEKTCKSIVNQTYQDFKWVVVDGGSTKEILEMALVEAGFKKCKLERITILEGDILKISADGKIEKTTFEVQEDFFTSYRWCSYSDWYDRIDAEQEEDDIILEDDISFLGYCFGVDESDIELLLDYGYALEEIEDMLLDSDCFETALKQAKSLFGKC